jgi:hypothetical protein
MIKVEGFLLNNITLKEDIAVNLLVDVNIVLMIINKFNET